MKAIFRNKYGPPDVLGLKEVKKPVPKKDEVLVKVHAASVNPADGNLLRGNPYFIRLMFGGILNPSIKILGADLAGKVEEAGANVKQFKPGDEVFGDTSQCGWGSFAEYVCAKETALAPMPSGTTFEQAAAVPMASMAALLGLRDKGNIQPGQRVLINGSSGGVGTFAVQIAKAFGAEVTAVCSTINLEMVRSIGADKVIDYTKDDFTQQNQKYHLIFDTVANHSAVDTKRVLSPKGIYVASAFSAGAALLGPWISITEGKKMRNMLSKPNQKDLVFLKRLIETEKLSPVIKKRYSLDEVPQAMRYLETGHSKGKVIICI